VQKVGKRGSAEVKAKAEKQKTSEQAEKSLGPIKASEKFPSFSVLGASVNGL